MTGSFLANQFLITMPGLEDPSFFHSVTYICEQNKADAIRLDHQAIHEYVGGQNPRAYRHRRCLH